MAPVLRRFLYLIPYGKQLRGWVYAIKSLIPQKSDVWKYPHSKKNSILWNMAIILSMDSLFKHKFSCSFIMLLAHLKNCLGRHVLFQRKTDIVQSITIETHLKQTFKLNIVVWAYFNWCRPKVWNFREIGRWGLSKKVFLWILVLQWHQL